MKLCSHRLCENWFKLCRRLCEKVSQILRELFYFVENLFEMFLFMGECFRQSENFSAFFSRSSMSPAKSLVQISICFSFHIEKSVECQLNLKSFSLFSLCFLLCFENLKLNLVKLMQIFFLF